MLETFFVGFLGVPRATAQSLWGDLKGKVARKVAVAELKDALLDLNDALNQNQRRPSPDDFLETQFLPVRHPDNGVELNTPREDFVITDRKDFHDAFKGKARLLDFSFEEVRRLDPLIQWLGISRLYLSRSVKEISRAWTRR
jgi:hypothetical protein